MAKKLFDFVTNQRILYIIICTLLLVIFVLGYIVYNSSTRPADQIPSSSTSQNR